MSRLHGKSGRILMSTTGSGAVSAITQSQWELDMGQDQAEVTSFGDGNKTYVTGLKDLKGTFSGFLETAEETIFQAADSADGAKLYLYPDASNHPSKYWYGTANISGQISVSATGAIATSGSFSARGTWTRIWA
jgi:hypothetical protein